MDAQLNGLTACKICSSSMFVRYRLPRYLLLECYSCGFRAIPYLDDESSGLTQTATEDRIRQDEKYADQGLESSKDRLTALTALVRQNVAEGGAVLDVGCGAGHVLRSLTDSYRTTGIELAPSWFEISRRRGVNVVAEPLSSRYWDQYRSTFDAITLFDVIEHVNQPLEVCRRALELLAPGGVLLMDTPNADGLLYRFGDFTSRISRGRYPTTLGLQYRPTPFDHKQIFRKRDMRKMLAAAGFPQIRITTKTEFSLPIGVYLQQMPSAAKLTAPALKYILPLLPWRNKMIVKASR